MINKFNSGTSNAFNWHVALSQWIPAYGLDINEEPGLYAKVMEKARTVLLEGKTSGYRSGMAHANHLFDRIDLDGDGVLSKSEISNYLSRHTSMHPHQIEVRFPPSWHPTPNLSSSSHKHLHHSLTTSPPPIQTPGQIPQKPNLTGLIF